MKKKVTALLIALLCVSTSLTGCNTSKVVMSYGDSVITENVFKYYLSYYKNIYLQTYSDMKDEASYYQTILPDGQTAEEYLFNMTVENVMMTLICMEEFDKAGLTIADSVKNEVDEYLTDLVNEYAGGDKKSLNATLSQYGVNLKMLSGIYMDQDKSSYLYDYLYGDNGTIGVTDEDKQTYLEENYCHVIHMYVNDAYYYPLTEDGYVQTDSNGNYITSPLTEEMLIEKNATIEAIDTALAAGEDFIDVYDTYSEDHYYENGYYLSQSMDFIDEVIDTAFSMEMNTWQKVHSDYGTHYIYKIPMDASPWNSEANADFFDDFETTVASELFMEYVRTYLSEVEVDWEVLNTYSVEASAVNYRF